MSKIAGLMDTGRHSMMNSQTALQTTGHNIANKSTEGYSRQRVEIVTNEPIGHGKLRIGTGAKTASINRINNPFIERQIGNEQAKLGYLEAKGGSLGQVEQVFNEQASKGLNTSLSEMFNAFRELSNNPESLSTRTQVAQIADSVAKTFRRVSDTMVAGQAGIDQQLASHVKEVNDLSSEIATLNEKVQVETAQGGPANDERDRRDLLIKKLSEKINIRWAEGEDGMVTITAGTSAVIVAGYDSRKLDTKAVPGEPGKEGGALGIYYRNSENGSDFNLTNQFTGGQIGGLLDVRDKVGGVVIEKIDSLAEHVMNAVNSVHALGVDAHGNKAGEFFSLEPQEGPPGHAASRLMLSTAIANDANKIAASADIDSPGDNRVALRLGHLEGDSIMDGGGSTLNEFYNSIVGDVGLSTKRATSGATAQADVVKQLNNLRESVSGVSLDEETTKLIEYQKSFDASARLVKTADELFDTVLNLKRS